MVMIINRAREAREKIREGASAKEEFHRRYEFLKQIIPEVIGIVAPPSLYQLSEADPNSQEYLDYINRQLPDAVADMRNRVTKWTYHIQRIVGSPREMDVSPEAARTRERISIYVSPIEKEVAIYEGSEVEETAMSLANAIEKREWEKYSGLWKLVINPVQISGHFAFYA